MSDLIPKPEQEDVPLNPVPVLEEKEDETDTRVSFSKRESLYIAPIPPSTEMKGYEEAFSGSADRILSMAENEQAHSHDIERLSLMAEIEDLKRARGERRLGQIFAFMITIILGGCGTAAILNGQPFAGSVLGASGVTGVVSVFITGRRGQGNPNQKEQNGDTPSTSKNQ